MEFKRKKQKFISLKEAAKLSGYSSDYIGYLIRQRKIPGKKIYSKIAWATTEEAIKEYEAKKVNKKEQERVTVRDISPSEKEVSEIKNQKAKRKNLLSFSWRLGLIIFLIIYLITGFAPIRFIQESIRALSKETKVVNLYSQNCLGDWQNPENTQGKPEVGPEGDLNSFSEINSAVYKSGPSYIICQDFIKEDQPILELPEDGPLEVLPVEEGTTTEEIEEGTTTEEEITSSTSAATSATEIINQILEGTSSQLEEELSTGTETFIDREIPISFFEKAKESFGNQEVLAQEKNEQFKSVKIKFSFAIGKEKINIQLIEQATDTQFQSTSSTLENEATSSEATSSEKPISFWHPIRNFISNGAGKVKNLFKFEDSIVKAEENSQSTTIETVIPESAITEDIIATPTTTDITATATDENFLSTSTEIVLDLDERIIIWYSVDGEMWWKLGSISGYPLSNALNNGYFEYDASFLENWEDINNLKIKFEGVTKEESDITSFLDSVWIEVTYDEKKKIDEQEESKITLLSSKKIFKSGEKPEFRFQYNRKNNQGVLASLGEVVGLNDANNWKDKNVIIEVEDYQGFKSTISPELVFENNDEFSIRLNKPLREFRPGRYILKIKIEDSLLGSLQSTETEQDFVWGVLAVNTNKSIFLPEESVYLQMAALRDSGDTICDANLSLEITTPSGSVSELEVQRSGECGRNNVTDIPDYYAFYQVSELGTYNIKLTNLDNQYEISDSFEVRDSVPFDIERFGPTRIYPFAEYKMIIRVKSNQDFVGEVIESVPWSFEIESPNASNSDFEVQNSGDEKKIVWSVDWEAGEINELKYQFDAPDIFPYFYLLGPLQIGNFQEIRQWQIAADAGGDTVIFIVNQASTTWTVPLDWNNSSNSIEVIGGGGGGDGDASTGNGGGGGGAYAKISTLTLIAGTNATTQVGQGGATDASGTDTFFNRTAGTATICTAGQMSVCAKGGQGGNTLTGGNGGASTTGSIGDIIYKGGNGGFGSTTGDVGGGGGGAAGPKGAGAHGNGCNGGAVTNCDTTGGGAGGGGGGGGSCTNGVGGDLRSVSGSGGQGYLNSGGGSATSTSGGAGGPGTSTAGGGGGGFDGGAGGAGTTSVRWTASVGGNAGPGGGGGGAGDNCTGNGGAGGVYGGGGGGSEGTGGTGGQGVIVIAYYPSNLTPSVSNINLNKGGNIYLVENAATSVSAYATVTDNNNYTDLKEVIGRLFWSKATNATNCTTNVNDCTATTTCATSSCSGNDCNATCNFSLWFPATPTDADAASAWNCWIQAKDVAGATGGATNTSQNIEVITLLALDVTDNINYGTLLPNAKNDPLDKLVKATTTGNVPIDANISGIDMCKIYPACNTATTAIGWQKYATTSGVAYDNAAAWVASTSARLLEFSTVKPTATPSDQVQSIYWGTLVPTGTAPGNFTGVNTFSAQPD